MLQPIKVGHRISVLREEKELKQADLAGIMGINEEELEKWESGVKLPPTELLPKLAVMLECTIDYLLLMGDSSTLKIKEAYYGVNQTYLNCTARVNSKIVNNEVTIPVNNGYFAADPVPGADKVLAVTIENEGRGYAVFVPEGTKLDLSLDMLTKPILSNPDSIHILYACYGSWGGRMDVKETLASLISVDGGTVNVSNGTFGNDPSPNIRKQLTVVYCDNKGMYVRNAKENEIMMLKPDDAINRAIDFGQDTMLLAV
ncbi:helix-turn-helix domain-containing protein [Paenibacillus sedimenti]|uniref:Helix-turn-helix domain-containing protein n=1 Tax=Paenibacillus sedimenti TaxID=2770274 RepID=A0A926KZ19_9BACL|nr:helix-turn-helix domain-containing protein [Paenibacillus sedimenti]MBD0384734.1 helix-turn-helix domain-containing protein [Paenibacillus sedimenti]